MHQPPPKRGSARGLRRQRTAREGNAYGAGWGAARENFGRTAAPRIHVGGCDLRSAGVPLRQPRRGGDAARGAVLGLQVQPAAGCGAGDPAGHRRGGAARDVGLSAQHHRQRRHRLPAHHDQPRHHRQRRPQPARLPGGPGAAAVSRLPHRERGQRGGGHRAGRPRDAAHGGAARAAGGGDGLHATWCATRRSCACARTTSRC